VAKHPSVTDRITIGQPMIEAAAAVDIHAAAQTAAA
jgi:hypothetical protein